jgi:hypothetical protein
MLDIINKIDIEKFTDPEVKSVLQLLMNIVEQQHETIVELREKNQKLRDEINRLKGEDGKPNIKGKTKKRMPKDISSEKERKKRKKNRSCKSKEIPIDTRKTCNFSPEELSKLPDDIRPQGFAEFIVQDLEIGHKNTLFKRAVYYSPSQQKTYTAPFPADHTGHFGATLRSYILCLKNICNMTESKIVMLLDTIGISISPASVSDILIKNHENFHEEKEAIVDVALESSLYHQIDDTSVRFDGKNYYCHVLCNELYTAFETTEKKDRLTILRILLNGRELRYSINAQTFAVLDKLQVGKKYIKVLEKNYEEGLSEKVFAQKLDNLFPTLGPLVRKNIRDAAAIAWYQTSETHQIIECLICDDAPQFKLITTDLALCWVHDGRHYKKLTPGLKIHQKKVDTFLTKYWEYYHQLLSYKSNPSPLKARQLRQEFITLFSKKTGYVALDDRINKTYGKIEELLLVLKYPWIPLHNNQSELAARVMTRIEDVSLHSVTKEGLRARDTFASIIDTARKLGVNAFDYIYDKVSKTFEMKTLPEIIKDLSSNPSLVT